MDLVTKAIQYAKEKHQHQLYGKLPYFKHLVDVDNVLFRFGIATDINRILAYLHDVIEDNTNITVDHIKEEFNQEIALGVHALTDGEGKNRRERKEKLFNKLWNYQHFIPVKLADRIANVEWCIITKSDLIKMYVREHAEFERNLRINVESMWDHLSYLHRISQLILLINKPL